MQIKIVSLLFALLAVENGIELTQWILGGSDAWWYIDWIEWLGKVSIILFLSVLTVGIWKRWYWVKFAVLIYVGLSLYVLLTLVYAFYKTGMYTSEDLLFKVYIGIPVLITLSIWVCTVCFLGIKSARNS